MFDFIHPDYRHEEVAPHWVKEILHRQELTLKNQERIMSTLQDAQAAQASTDTAISGLNAELLQVKTDVEAVLTKLSNLPQSGQLTPEQQAAIDDITAHANNINNGLSSIGQNLTALDTETNAAVSGAGGPNTPVSPQAHAMSASDLHPDKPKPTNQPGNAPAGPV